MLKARKHQGASLSFWHLETLGWSLKHSFFSRTVSPAIMRSRHPLLKAVWGTDKKEWGMAKPCTDGAHYYHYGEPTAFSGERTLLPSLFPLVHWPPRKVHLPPWNQGGCPWRASALHTFFTRLNSPILFNQNALILVLNPA